MRVQLLLSICAGMLTALQTQAADLERPGVPAVVQGSVKISNSDTEPNLSRVVVYLASHPMLDGMPVSPQRAVMAQRNKAFVGDLLVISRGTTVEFPNEDPFSHNVFSRSRAASFDLDRYPAGQSKSYTFQQPGIVQLFCNIHPNMKATILVVPNRFFTRASKEGTFRLDGVPPGSYELVAWHERCQEQHQAIQTGAAMATNVSLTLQANSRRAPAAAAAPASGMRRPSNVERGLGVKRERLNLPVIRDSHPAARR